jgi:serine/threonine protein kinase
VTASGCKRHPRVALYRGLCAACLIEEALASEPDRPPQPIARFTIQLPLGATAASSVFLATGEWPWRRLLRLKTWRRPAQVDFARRFAALEAALERVHDEAIVMPLAAWTDAEGCPCVLTEFRQGLPLLDCVESGRLAPGDARDALRVLLEKTAAAHRRGLAHGSIVPGNVFWRPDGSTFLLDFGLAPAITADEPPIPWPRLDLAGFASLERSLRQLDRGAASKVPV